METLQINNFCGIIAADLTLAPISLIIGPQATGKSVAAKLVYFFREVISTLPSFIQAQTEWKTFRQQIGQRFIGYFGAGGYGVGPFEVKYGTADIWLRITQKSDDSAVIFESSKDFATFYSSLLELIPKASIGAEGADAPLSGALAKELRQNVVRKLKEKLGESASFEQFLVPAARASLSLLNTQAINQLLAREGGDVWMLKFAELVSSTRNTLKSRGFYDGKAAHDSWLIKAEVTKNYRNRIRSILRADVDYDGVEERLKLDDGRVLSLLRASSGQQESLPLLLLLCRFTMLSHVDGRSVFIEEPEAHLWPGAQREIVHLLAEMFSQRKAQMQLLLTTHSPYVFSVFNNLLEAGRIYADLDERLKTATNGEKRKLQERRQLVSAIIRPERALPPGSVGAWQFDSTGITNLMDDEHGVIGADLLDRVSENIDTEWRSLQDFVE